LLKSPFCVHPKTGRVCVPIDPADVDSFNPFTVPTISQLCDELNEIEKSDENPVLKQVKDYRKTSLMAYIAVFERFLRKLDDSRRPKRECTDLQW